MEEFPRVSTKDVAEAMSELADEPTTLMFHAEMIPPISKSVGDSVTSSLPPLAPSGPVDQYSTFLDSRPPAFETYAIEEVISLASLAPNLPLHIVHLSALEAIPVLRRAQAAGVKITAETCFHYLSLAAEGIADGDTRHKCCPPIRTQANQDCLWEELTRKNESVIQTVVSDHSPCTPDLKLLPYDIAGASKAPSEKAKGDFFAAWGGVSSVGLGISILWTEGSKRGIKVEDIVRWCCRNTAKQVGLEYQKGDLRAGLDGDVAVFDDEAEWEVVPSTMLFRNKCSPYQGRRLRGVIRETWLRGERIHGRGSGFNEKLGPTGKLLLEQRKTNAD